MAARRTSARQKSTLLDVAWVPGQQVQCLFGDEYVLVAVVKKVATGLKVQEVSASGKTTEVLIPTIEISSRFKITTYHSNRVNDLKVLPKKIDPREARRKKRDAPKETERKKGDKDVDNKSICITVHPKTLLHSTEVNTDISRYTTSKGMVYVQDISEEDFASANLDVLSVGDNAVTQLSNYMNEQRGGNFLKTSTNGTSKTHYIKYVSGGSDESQGKNSSSSSSSSSSSTTSSSSSSGCDNDVCSCGCEIPMLEIDQYKQRKKESRDAYSDGGTTTSCSGWNALLKQPTFVRQKKKTKANVPIIHEGRDKNGERYIDVLRKNKLLKFIMKRQDALVRKAYPLLWQFIIDYVPEQYLLFPGLCFTYCAKTGGTDWGTCFVLLFC